MENNMKQILYIPSGKYFLWFDTTKNYDYPILSAEECLIKEADWCRANGIIDIQVMLDKIVETPNYFNPKLYTVADIDIDTEKSGELLYSEFEIVEDGK
jgi:hypothetical protein